jgi:SH3-like domain-containing protein
MSAGAAIRLSLLPLLLAALAPMPAAAASDDLQLPGWASLRASEINMRVGPGEDYRINWVYHRAHLPVKVLRAMEGWRLVQDPDGARGWVIVRFLNRERTVFVTAGEPAEMHAGPDADSALLWKLSHGVVGKLGACADGWCQLDADGRKGYVEAGRLWGAGTP